MTTEANCRILVLATGGTIEKAYDAEAGGLSLVHPNLETTLDTLYQPLTEVVTERLMAIDSLDMTTDDQARIAETLATHAASGHYQAVIVTHGTDRLVSTAERVAQEHPGLPVLFTGAMVPAACAHSDAHANLAQALLASRLLAAGVHVVMHGRAIPIERAAKDYERQTFVDAAAEDVAKDSANGKTR